MKAINPATGTLLFEYPEHDSTETERRLDRARLRFEQWRHTPFPERSAMMRGAAARLRDGMAEYAGLMTDEMGKPIGSSEAEIEKCAWTCEFFAEHAERFLAPEEIPTDARRSFVSYEPLGAILAVMPWNFPFWQVFRCAVPALMAGNVVVLKHASNVPGCALAIERVFGAAGFPEGAFTTLLVGAAAVERLIAHPTIAAVSLTGSEPAGIAVASSAGKSVKKIVLELGGSDPFVVLADADPEHAAEQAAAARTINSGQSCIAAKRFIAEDPVAERFEAALVRHMSALRVGDPRDRAIQVGPLAREDLLAELEGQVERSIERGAVLRAGGRRLARAGYFFPPTVLASVEPGMPVFDEETFGPVAAVIRARDERHAIELANRSRYGLGASIWTSDPRRGETLAREVEAGAVFVNGIVKSDPRLPFGGIKRSGHGRELGRIGIREFVNVKTVWVG